MMREVFLHLPVVVFASIAACAIAAHGPPIGNESTDVATETNQQRLSVDTFGNFEPEEARETDFVPILFQPWSSKAALDTQRRDNDRADWWYARWGARSFAGRARPYAGHDFPASAAHRFPERRSNSLIPATDGILYGEDLNPLRAFLASSEGMRSSDPLGSVVNLPALALMNQASRTERAPNVIAGVTYSVPLSLYAVVLVWLGIVGTFLYRLPARWRL